MPPLNSNNQTNPFMYHSAFKLSVYFKNNKRSCKPFHSVETTATVAQVLHNKIKEISFDRRNGYQLLIDKVNDMQHKIHTAFLYDAYEENICFAKFVGGKWFHMIEPDFSQNFIQVSTNFRLFNGFVICKDIAVNALATNAKFLQR